LSLNIVSYWFGTQDGLITNVDAEVECVTVLNYIYTPYLVFMLGF